MPSKSYPPVDLDDLITHDDLLARYPWLSGQIIGRWRRKRGLRYFRGGKEMIVYPMSDIVRCLNEDMEEGREG